MSHLQGWVTYGSMRLSTELSTGMQELLWAVGAGVLGGAAIFGLLRLVVPRQRDVDELAVEVDRLARVVRRHHMQRVRAAAAGASDPDPAEIVAASAPAPQPAGVSDPRQRKTQLRRLL